MRRSVVAAILSCLCACRPRQDAGAPPSSEGPLQLHFDVAALNGAKCTLRVENSTGPSSIVVSTTELALAFATAGPELTMRIESVQSDLGIASLTAHTRITTELIDQPTDDEGQVIRKAADDPDARREIEAITGGPRVFARIDDRGEVLDYREDLATQLKIPDLGGFGLAWLLGLPQLPDAALRKGVEWQGVRFLPSKKAADADDGIPISYRLLRVRRGIATIAMQSRVSNEIGTKAGKLAGSVSIIGEAHVRVADGRPLETDLEVRMDFQSSSSAAAWTWRYAGKCAR